MPHKKLLVYENYAYLNEHDRERHGIVKGEPQDLFTYNNLPPEELWRVEGENGSTVTENFQTALNAFQKGGNRMVKIEVVFFEN